MPTLFRLAGLTEASIDNEGQDVRFVLKVSDGRGLAFVAEAAVARQIASSLGRVALDARPSAPQVIGAEKISKYGVKIRCFWRGGAASTRIRRRNPVHVCTSLDRRNRHRSSLAG